MKLRLFYLLILVIATVFAFSSCDEPYEPPPPPEPNIIMTTAKSGMVSIQMRGSGSAEIDWGDGTKDGVFFYNNIPETWTNNYADSSVKTIKITGVNVKITFLDCGNNGLTSLDLANVPALTELRCYANKLTTLDLSKNSALTTLNCYDNELKSLDTSGLNALKELHCNFNFMNVAALNALFGTLNSTPVVKYIYIGNNGPNHDGSGTEGCNKSIAEEKGWLVF